MNKSRTLIVIAYAPALARHDDRALAIVHRMEQSLPGLRLQWKLAEGGRPTALPDRDAWLAEHTLDGAFPLLCNGDESYPITVSGRDRSGLFSPGGQDQLEVHARLPLDEAGIAAASALLEGMAEGASAFWGHASPESYGSEVARQFRRSPQAPERSPRGLPMLDLPEKLSAPETPCFLGWLNHWSSAAAKVIGFPSPDHDTGLLSRARRTASDGWVVQLTDSPLDYDNPSHLDALRRAYERFPALGRRTA
ncbi:DUF5953 family protein [Myxococcus sp. K38C18041901]|uniref:DUF5953 family protein n=1 Tax=Myxococcus guangdongensis TaxID=2906760 RepID=UPI0020A70010|nr:DUF5953 family protein [Myxococcus guangdongensis]MCP3062708.1 DUF5953 family protein [Myxococcus guangdongensis]